MPWTSSGLVSGRTMMTSLPSSSAAQRSAVSAVQGDDAHRGARRHVEALAGPGLRRAAHCAAVELRVEEEVHLLGLHPLHRLLAGDQAFFDHVDGDAHLGLGRALAVAGLQQPELAPCSTVNSMSCMSRIVLLELVGGSSNSRRPPASGRSSSLIGSVWRVPATTSSPWAFIRNSPSSSGSPGRRIAATWRRRSRSRPPCCRRPSSGCSRRCRGRGRCRSALR